MQTQIEIVEKVVGCKQDPQLGMNVLYHIFLRYGRVVYVYYEVPISIGIRKVDFLL